VYEAYKKAPNALKRQYLGLFWEQFLVQDKEIVKAVPTRMIRVLQQQREVILGSKWRASPTLIITMQDVSYVRAIRERLLAIQALQNGTSPADNHRSLQQAI
jgi:hypothetical protein